MFVDEGAVVLIRALEPVSGQDTMRKHRGKIRSDHGIKLKDHHLCNGPSKLCMALDISKERFNKTDLTSSDILYVKNDKSVPDSDIVISKRIGLDKQPVEWQLKPWRFYVFGCSSVSVRDKNAEEFLSN